MDNFFFALDNYFFVQKNNCPRQKKIVLMKLLRKTKIFVRLMKVEKARTNEKIVDFLSIVKFLAIRTIY